MNEFMNLHRNIKLRLLSMFITELAAFSIFGNLTIYYTRNFGEMVSGILLTVASIGSFFVSLYGGHLSDIKGRKLVLKIGLTLEVSGYFFAMFANQTKAGAPIFTAMMFILTYLSFHFTNPVFEAMIVDVTSPEQRPFVYTLSYWLVNISVLLGTSIGAWLFQDHLFQLLLFVVVGHLVGWLLSVVFMDETKPPILSSAEGKFHVLEVLKNYKKVVKDSKYLFYILGYLCSTIFFLQLETSVAAHLALDFQTVSLFGVSIYGQRMVAIMTFTNTVVIIGSVYFLKYWTKGWSLFTRYTVGAIFHGIGIMLAMLTHTLVPLLLLTLVFTLGEALVVPTSQTIHAKLVPSEKAGVYSGMHAAVLPTAQFLSGAIVSGGALFGNWGVVLILFMVTVFRICFTRKSIVK